MGSRRRDRFLFRSTLVIWYAECCLLQSLPLISNNESRLSIIRLCNWILNVQNTVEHLSLFSAWETSNHIICSSLIRTPRTVPFLSISSKTFLQTLSETTSTPVPFSDLLLKLRVLELYQLVSLIHHGHKLRYQFHFPLSLLLCLLIVCREGEKIKLEIMKYVSRTWEITAVQQTAVDQISVRVREARNNNNNH